MLEDSPADSELVTAALERVVDEVSVKRVDSPDAFADALREFAPDVVLCDHKSSAFDPRGALELMRGIRPAVPLILVSHAVDEVVIVESLRAGAEDLVLKSNLHRLPDSIAAALDVRADLATLSPRQVQVLRLIAEGHTTPAIAARLRISAKTVETHRSELMKRLGIHELAGLVRFAVRVGLVPLDV